MKRLTCPVSVESNGCEIQVGGCRGQLNGVFAHFRSSTATGVCAGGREGYLAVEDKRFIPGKLSLEGNPCK